MFKVLRLDVNGSNETNSNLLMHLSTLTHIMLMAFGCPNFMMCRHSRQPNPTNFQRSALTYPLMPGFRLPQLSQLCCSPFSTECVPTIVNRSDQCVLKFTKQICYSVIMLRNLNEFRQILSNYPAEL